MSRNSQQLESVCKIYCAKKVKALARPKRIVRKHLNADALIRTVRKDFQEILDHRADNTKISLDDALMSALAMFQLKDPSLLAFDKRRREEPENLHTVFGVAAIPCDSQMRTILDPVQLSSLRAPFHSVFRQVQRGKDFEKKGFPGWTLFAQWRWNWILFIRESGLSLLHGEKK